MPRSFEQILPEVEKPARYLGGERNSVVKSHGAVRSRAVLAFPDVYEIGMSHLGLRILYSLLNRREDMLLERCFAPWPDMERALRDAGLPLLSLETRTPLSRFDVVGFSLQYELSFTNVLMMLDLAGIPLRSEDRDERHPLVIAGGPVVFSPEPVADFFDLFLVGDGEEVFPKLLEDYAALREGAGLTGRGGDMFAPEAEGMAIVEPPPAGRAVGGLPARGEEALRSAVGATARVPAPSASGNGDGAQPSGGKAASGHRFDLRQERIRILKELARLPGIYVPSLYRTEEDRLSKLHYVAGPDAARLLPGEDPPPFPVRRATLDDLNRFPFPADTIVPHSEIVHDRVSIELARGCTEGCRFCQAGTIYRPVRERSAESIIDSALDALEKTGYDEVSLTSLSPADYSCLPDLVEKMMDRLAEARVGLSVSSLRPYGLTEQLAAQIGRVKMSGFTIAPEAGTQRMRDVLNKGINEEHILQAANNAFGAGWDLIKTYFMIGLPTETEEDLLGMLALCEKIHDIGRHRLSKKNGGPGGAPRIHFSASSHVPKPHAAFQWARMESAEDLYGKQRFLAARLRNPRIRFKRHHVETSILECVMSRGDRRLGAVIETAYRKGCRFDGWTELFRWKEWQEAFAECALPMEQFLAELPLDSRLPWDHIDTTVLKDFLVREWNRALKAKATPPCEKPYKKFNRPFRRDDKLICYDCGCECDLPHIREERVANHEGLLAIRSTRTPVAAAPATSPAFRYRATFRKEGRSRFLSHLDLIRLFGRAFRRAGIRLKYSQGFNPKPLLAFTPALALGAEGMREAVDFQLGEPASPASLSERLNSALPEGIRVESISVVAAGEPSLTAATASARYRVTVPLQIEEAPRHPGRRGSGSVETMPFNEESGLREDEGPAAEEAAADPSGAGGAVSRREARPALAAIMAMPACEVSGIPWHQDRIEEFNGRPTSVIDKVRKGRTVKVDLKEFSSRVSLVAASETKGVTLSFEVKFRDGASVRPEEILTGIYGFVPRGIRIVREDLQLTGPAARSAHDPHAAPAAPPAG